MAGAEELVELEELSLPLGTCTPTVDNALDTADCAGGGNEPVAAAALPAVSATAGRATPSAFNVRSLEIMWRFPFRCGVSELPGALETAAVMAATAAARSVRLIGFGAPLAAPASAATGP